MRKLVIQLFKDQHFRTLEGKQVIRQSLEQQGYRVKSEFDGSLSVYENESRMVKDALFLVLLCLMVVGYLILLFTILGGLL